MKRPIYIGKGLIPQVERHLMFEAVNTSKSVISIK